MLSGWGGSRDGIIPAFAGSTVVEAAPVTPGRDHPRIRGEHPPSSS